MIQLNAITMKSNTTKHAKHNATKNRNAQNPPITTPKQPTKKTVQAIVSSLFDWGKFGNIKILQDYIFNTIHFRLHNFILTLFEYTNFSIIFIQPYNLVKTINQSRIMCYYNNNFIFFDILQIFDKIYATFNI